MILISQGVTWSATVATGFTFFYASKLSATAASRPLTTSQRTGGWHGRQPVFFMVFHASMALCRSIRRWVIGTGGTVLVAGVFLKHVDNPTETPTCPAVEVAVTRLTTNSGY